MCFDRLMKKLNLVVEFRKDIYVKKHFRITSKRVVSLLLSLCFLLRPLRQVWNQEDDAAERHQDQDCHNLNE